MPLSNTDVQLASVSSSASTFPQLSSSEIDILSQILCCTPSDTTAFNALLRPYRDTLQKNSIDPKKDEKFYSFLLKLSLVPGSDWRTKWQKVLSEQLSLKSKHSGHRPSSLAKINSHAVPSTSRIQALQSKPSKSVHFLPLGELVRTSDDPTLPAQPTLTKVSYPDFESPRFTDPSDVIARRARRRQLLQHFLNRWQIEIIKWHELASEVDKARITIDKSLAYQTWKQKAKYLNNKSNAVTRAYETRTLEIGLKRWRDLSYFQRQKKWRNLMKKTYQNIQTVSKQELCRRVLIIWVNHVRSSAFYMSSSRNLVLRLLRNWVHNTRNIDRLRSVSDNFQLQVDIAQVRYLLKRWQYIRVTNLKVDQFLAANKLQRKSRVYAYWRYLCYQRQKARVQLFKSRLRQFFKSLRSSYEYQLLLKQTVIRVTILRDQNNKLKFFRHWVIYERGIFLERARKTRLLRLCLRLWSHKMEFVTIRLPTIGRQLKLRYPFLLSHSLLLQWRERICMIHHYQEKSIHRYESSIIRKFYLAWKSKRERCLQSILVSAISRKKLVCAKLFKIWNRKAHKRKQIIWLQLRTIRHLQFNFTVWKEAVRLRRRLLGNILEFQFVIQKRLRGKIFLKWRSRKDFLSENTFLAKSENLQRLKRFSSCVLTSGSLGVCSTSAITTLC
ncbi:expressed protein [Phakopsora pachyrhizi]|uniref:Expressed protein n=1 Tax=Phakopsora pachyrhizi TaxID=170000 RepID=A0AAV0B1Q5_PHAPC|nr:expressed protein [Phakopsora pachyrhizi]